MKKLLIIIILVAIGVIGYRFIIAHRSATAPHSQQQALELLTHTVSRQDILLIKELPARVVASKTAQIRPQVDGIITKRLFTEGHVVKQGEQLYQIDPAPYEAAKLSAQADLAKAKANVESLNAKYTRYQNLAKVNAISKQELDDITAQLAQAKADVAIAKASITATDINVNYTKVYAPISGQIGKSNITEGALVTKNQEQPLATITQLDPIYVDMTQSTEELIKMRQYINDDKTTVSLYFGANNESYDTKGVIQFSEVTVDPTTNSVQLRALFPNPEHFLLPGMFVRAHISISHRDVIAIPQRATLREASGEPFVYVVTATHELEKRPVKTGQAQGNKWVISDGLNPGDVILMEGFQKVAPGMKIIPISSKEPKTISTDTLPKAKE